jgi:hypothetical protein
MTTFTSEDVNSLLTDWFSGEVDPVNPGSYEVKTASWPWPHRLDWNSESGWDITGGPVLEWRGLKIRIPE